MHCSEIEKISKALSDATRLRILEAISAGYELTCGDLVSMRGVTPATVSHHLKILNEAGLIECRREGQRVQSRALPSRIREYSRALARLAKKKKPARQGKHPLNSKKVHGNPLH